MSIYQIRIDIPFEAGDDIIARTIAKEIIQGISVDWKILCLEKELPVKLRRIYKDKEPRSVKLHLGEKDETK